MGIETFQDLLKRGNLPDDDREVPNWLKIKNRQFDDVDVTHNNIDSIVALTNEEFNEFVTSVNTDMFLVYLSTMSKSEMQKFYKYLGDVVKIKEDVEAPSAKNQFLSAMNGIEVSTITDESRARATLETPLMINSSKNIYHKIIDFTEHISQDYYDYNSDDDFKMYEGSLSKIIWNDMKYIPDNFEQVLDHFKENFYNEKNEDHQEFVKHLASRFGLLIATLNNLIVKTENRNSSLNWFTGVMVEQKLLTSGDISVSKTKSLSTDQKLINLHALTFLAIVDENDDNYLSNLISVVETMFEYYPVNREACEYVMVEMMKSIAMKEVTVENANAFMEFFGELPRFYELLSYDNIYELKELISHTLANDKPQDNKVFEEEGVKNKIILLNYLVDMEDLYYASTVESRADKKYTLFLAEYIKLFGTLKNESDLRGAGLWDHRVIIDSTWDRFDSIIKDKSAGSIGWMSPVTADIFDMRVEIPVVFEKINGEYLSVGVPLELVELQR